MKRIILCLLFTTSALFNLEATAQLGIGGVGDDPDNRFWYRPDELTVVPDGSELSNWNNEGGSSADASQSNTSFRPLIHNSSTNRVNDYPVIYFDGIDDQLTIESNSDIDNYADPLASRTYYIAFQTSDDTQSRQVIYEEGDEERGFIMYLQYGRVFVATFNHADDGPGAPFGFKYRTVSVAPNSQYLITAVYNGNSNRSGKLDVYGKGAWVGAASGVGLLYPHPGETCLGSRRNGGYLHNGGFEGDGDYFKGGIMEFGIYNEAHGKAKRRLIENYFNGKYDLDTQAQELFAFDNGNSAQYDHHITGIGKASDGSSNLTGQGTGILKISGCTDLDENEHMMWGRNSYNYNWIQGDVPDFMDGRLENTWIIDETGGDVGEFNLMFDLGLILPPGATDYRVLMDLNNNGSFADDQVWNMGPVTSNGIHFNFAGMDIPESVPFTIAYAAFLLPVEWADFTAEENLGKVYLDWTTGSETNNEIFAIERSANGVEWQTIGFVDGAGNSTFEIEYQWVDVNPLLGTSYYRIRQNDYSGSVSFTNIETIQMESEEDLWGIFPNPGTGPYQVYNISPQSLDMEVIDLNGRTCQKFTVLPEERAPIDLASLPAGWYVLRNNRNLESTRFLHQP